MLTSVWDARRRARSGRAGGAAAARPNSASARRPGAAGSWGSARSQAASSDGVSRHLRGAQVARAHRSASAPDGTSSRSPRGNAPRTATLSTKTAGVRSSAAPPAGRGPRPAQPVQCRRRRPPRRPCGRRRLCPTWRGRRARPAARRRRVGKPLDAVGVDAAGRRKGGARRRRVVRGTVHGARCEARELADDGLRRRLLVDGVGDRPAGGGAGGAQLAREGLDGLVRFRERRHGPVALVRERWF